MCCNVMVGKKKEKKERASYFYIITLINLFRFLHRIWDFRTISWGCHIGCPSPIQGWFDPCHGQSLVGRKVFWDFLFFFQGFG